MLLFLSEDRQDCFRPSNLKADIGFNVGFLVEQMAFVQCHQIGSAGFVSSGNNSAIFRSSEGNRPLHFFWCYRNDPKGNRSQIPEQERAQRRVYFMYMAGNLVDYVIADRSFDSANHGVAQEFTRSTLWGTKTGQKNASIEEDINHQGYLPHTFP